MAYHERKMDQIEENAKVTKDGVTLPLDDFDYLFMAAKDGKSKAASRVGRHPNRGHNLTNAERRKAEAHDLNLRTVYNRLSRGWDREIALTKKSQKKYPKDIT